MWELIGELTKKLGIEIGLIIAVVLCLGLALYKAIEWIVNLYKKINALYEEKYNSLQAMSLERVTSFEMREKNLLALIAEATNALHKHTEQAQTFQNEVKSANEFQRKEHERIIEIVGDICTDHKEHAKFLVALSTNTENLVKTTNGLVDAVGRINGFQH